MTLFVISLIVIIVGLVILSYIVFKKIPDLKNLNVESLVEEQQGRAKKDILEAKFSRLSERFKSKVKKATSPQKGFLADKITSIKEKVANLEEKYKTDEDVDLKPKTTKELFTEAKKLIDNEEYPEAERILIEIIAKDSKNTQAYEELGDLYFQMKSYDQAEEIYKYLLKIKLSGSSGGSITRGNKMEELEADVLSTLDVDPKIAVYYEDLGQIYEIINKNDKALDAYLKAITIDPNNPKYLDKLIEMSIMVKDRGLAKKTFNSMRKINPKNAKLAQWEKAIEKL
jgi:tetratricopeptide (TPR) repeat protein